MKVFTSKCFAQKILIILMIVISITFLVPREVSAKDDFSVGGSLLKEILQLFASLGDIIMGLLNNVMLGADGVGSAMLDQADENLKNPKSWLYCDKSEKIDKQFDEGEIDTRIIKISDEKYRIPNMLYSPENIFADNIAALDVNFLRENKYVQISTSPDAEEAAESSAKDLKKTIASWYKSFRNIAVVGLLSVLIYIGIRILISSAADDKAKYKESLKDWLVALCLVFVIHFIMSGILMLNDKVVELFSTNINNGITVSVGGSDNATRFRTNLMGLVRFQAQSADWQTASAYVIIYLVLVIYTIRFTIIYFKRFLYTAFFTMIAPLVALTYPIDKIGDGKAQAFNMWFKEYTMNVIIQPVHLILYTVFVSSSMSLVIKNPIYALVAIGFLIPAEQFIKKMFGLDKAETTSGFGSFAGGALAMSGVKRLQSMSQSSSKGSSSKGGSSKSSDDGNSSKIRTVGGPDIGGAFGAINGEGEKKPSNIGLDPKKQAEKESLEEKIADGQIDKKDLSEEQRNLLGANMQDNTNDNSNESIENPITYNSNKNNDNDNETIDPIKQMRKEALEEKIANGEVNKEDLTKAQKNLLRYNTNNNKNDNKSQLQKGWKRKLAVNGAKKGLKGVYKGAKIATKGIGAVGGAAVGLAAGISTGDFSKTMQYMGVGVSAGSAVGSSVGTIPERIYNGSNGLQESAFDGIQNTKQKINEAKYGYQYAKNERDKAYNDRERAKILKNEKEQRKFADMAGKVGYEGDLNDFMNAAIDYKEAGVQDDKLIANALKVENKNGGVGKDNHDKVLAMAKLTHDGGYGKDYIEDDKKRSSMENLCMSKVNNDKDKAREMMQVFAGLHDREKMYNRMSGLK